MLIIYSFTIIYRKHRYNTIALEPALLCCALKKTDAAYWRAAIAVSGQINDRSLDLYSYTSFFALTA